MRPEGTGELKTGFSVAWMMLVCPSSAMVPHGIRWRAPFRTERGVTCSWSVVEGGRMALAP